MKRLMAVAALVVCALSAWADMWTDSGTGYTWTYSVQNRKAGIFNDRNCAVSPTPSGTLAIPATLGESPVASIGDRAFAACSNLTSVTMPSGVTSIGSWAFSDCSGLTQVTIPEGVKTIGSGAFRNCSGLTSVTIPASVTSIGYGGFEGCTGLLEVTFEGLPPTGMEGAGFPKTVSVQYDPAYEAEWAPVIAACGFGDTTSEEGWKDANNGIESLPEGLSNAEILAAATQNANAATFVYDGLPHSVVVPTFAAYQSSVKYALTREGPYSESPLQFVSVTVTNVIVWYVHASPLYPPAITNVALLSITQAPNAWTTEPSMTGWVYGETPQTPNLGAAKFGEVTVSYSATPEEPGDYVATFTVAETENYEGLSKDVSFSITSQTPVEPVPPAELVEALNGVGVVESDGDNGWKVTVTNDVTGPLEIPDNLGPVTIDLNGHDVVGADGEPGIRIVASEGAGDPTQLTIVSTDGPATVRGGAGAENAGIEVAESAREGVTVTVGEGVTVPDDDTGIRFAEEEFVTREGSNLVVRVLGGSEETNCSVRVYVGYQTASRADLDWTRVYVDGVRLPVDKKTKVVKLPLTLSWAAGEIAERTIRIPMKKDSRVEADETFTFLLAVARGMELGRRHTCRVTIVDANAASSYVAKMKARVTKKKTGVKVYGVVKTSVENLTEEGVPCGYTIGQGKYYKGYKATIKAVARPGWAFAGWWKNVPQVIEEGGTNRTVMVQQKWTTKSSVAWTAVTSGLNVVAKFRKRPYVRGVAEPANFGTVSVGGYGGSGKTVTLTAKPSKGKVFLGWYDGAGTRKTQSTKFAVKNATNDVTYVACFMTAAEDKASIALVAGGLGAMGLQGDAPAATDMAPGGSLTLTNMCGVLFKFPLASSALVSTTVTAKGLPKGLSLAKDTAAGAGCYVVKGYPQVASKTSKTTHLLVPTNVTLTVTTRNMSKQTYRLRMVTLPLPSWARGSFDGGAVFRGANASVSFSVATTGKISGKYLLESGKSYPFAASGYTSLDTAEARAAFRPKVTLSAKTSVVQEIELTEADGAIRVKEGVPLQMRGVYTEAGDGERLDALRNIWGASGLPVPTFPTTPLAVTLASGEVFEALGLQSGDRISLKFSAKGATTVSARINTFGEMLTRSATAKVRLHTYDAERNAWTGDLYLVVPKYTKTGFQGLSARLTVEILANDAGRATVVNVLGTAPWAE